MKVISWSSSSQGALMECIRLLTAGRIVVYPTDTVYGIAADPMRRECIARVNTLKSRAEDEPISICIPSFEWLEEYVDERYVDTARSYLPGPYTLLLPVKRRLPVQGRSPLLGVRMVSHPVVERIVERFGPITSTSANLHGMRPPRTVDEARIQLQDRIDLYIDAGETPVGRASRVISFERGGPKVLRM